MNDAEIIYLEVDAEITEAIDKLKSAKGDAVKVVVPARSSLLQSAVNLKLLKKAAKDHKKELALVTNDKTATYLAGGIGLAVAASLKAEPKVPEAIEEAIRPDIVEQDPEEVASGASGSGKSSSSSKGSKDSGSKKSSDEGVVKKREVGEEAALGAEDIAENKSKAKVPNYNAFQKKLWIGIGIFMGIVLAVILAITLPTATLTVLAKADKLGLNSDFIVDTSGVATNTDSLTFAGTKLTLQKDLTQNFTATGKKDVGTKAAGTVALKNCEDTDPRSVPAGSKLVANGLTFVSTNGVTVPAGSFSIVTGFKCSSPVNVSVAAVANGDQYNLGGATFLVSGTSKINGTGSTSGGTSKTVTVVTQADIDGAKQQAIDAAANESKDELLAKADKKDVVFEDTFATTTDSVTSSVPVDAEATNGTVTVKVTYSVVTASEATVNELLDTLAKDALPDSNQQLYQNGADNAKYTLLRAVSDTRYQLNVSADAYYGKKINTDQIAKDTAGKSKKDVTSIVQKDNPSVVSTQVDSTPSLLPNMPALSSHIKVIIKVSTD
jgi:hypothetical protein